VLLPVEDMGAVNVAVAEAGEVMAITVTMAAKTLMGFREHTVLEVVPELEVKKVPRTEALDHPIAEAEEVGGVGTVTVSLVMTLRGHLGGPMSAIVVPAMGMK
jgi:hypothetical protein